jgi:hypothetical protein
MSWLSKNTDKNTWEHLDTRAENFFEYKIRNRTGQSASSPDTSHEGERRRVREGEKRLRGLGRSVYLPAIGMAACLTDEVYL